MQRSCQAHLSRCVAFCRRHGSCDTRARACARPCGRVASRMPRYFAPLCRNATYFATLCHQLPPLCQIWHEQEPCRAVAHSRNSARMAQSALAPKSLYRRCMKPNRSDPQTPEQLKTCIRELDLEILFLRQALKARDIQAALAFAELEGKPREPWKGLEHNHLCTYCDETWRDGCLESDYLVTTHGCDAQHEATRRLAIALSMPSRWEAPYLSRRPKPKRTTRDQGRAATIAANESEIMKLRAQLHTSA